MKPSRYNRPTDVYILTCFQDSTKQRVDDVIVELSKQEKANKGSIIEQYDREMIIWTSVPALEILIFTNSILDTPFQVHFIQPSALRELKTERKKGRRQFVLSSQSQTNYLTNHTQHSISKNWTICRSQYIVDLLLLLWISYIPIIVFIFVEQHQLSELFLQLAECHRLLHVDDLDQTIDGWMDGWEG